MGRRVSTPEGAQIIQEGALPASRWTYAPPSGGITSSTTAVTAQAAPGASLRHYVRWVQVLASPLSGSTEAVIQDEDGGVLYRTGFTTAGGVINMEFPVPLQAPLNKAIQVKATSSVSGNIYFNIGGYKAA